MCDVGVIYDALMLEVFRKAHKGCMHAAEINLSHSHQTALYFSLTVFVCFNLSLFLCMCVCLSQLEHEIIISFFDRIQRLISLNCVRIGKRNSNNLNICVEYQNVGTQMRLAAAATFPKVFWERTNANVPFKVDQNSTTDFSRSVFLSIYVRRDKSKILFN